MISKTIIKLNEIIEARLEKLGDVSLFGLTQLVTVNESKLPAVQNQGELTYVGPDDIDCLRVYHRTENINYNTSKASYGDAKIIEETANMLMFVVYDLRKVNLTPEEVSSYISIGFPMFSKETLTDLQLKSCNVEAKGANFAESIAKSEFGKELPEDFAMFTIKYTVESRYSDCFDVCKQIN